MEIYLVLSLILCFVTLVLVILRRCAVNRHECLDNSNGAQPDLNDNAPFYCYHSFDEHGNETIITVRPRPKNE